MKGQKVKPGKHKQGSGKVVKGYEWKSQRQESRQAMDQLRLIWRQATVRMRGQQGLTERVKDERSGGSVWMTV